MWPIHFAMKYLLLLALGSVLACAVSQVDVKNANEARLNNVKQRASFDMGCPEARLEAVCLGTEGAGYCKTTGVTGCSKKATYTLVSTSGTPGSQREWILNSTVTETAKHLD